VGGAYVYVINGASYFSVQVAAPNSMELIISACRWQHLRLVNDRYSCGVACASINQKNVIAVVG
jgi:hypothetical protein